MADREGPCSSPSRFLRSSACPRPRGAFARSFSRRSSALPRVAGNLNQAPSPAPEAVPALASVAIQPSDVRIYYEIRYYQLPTLTPRLARMAWPYAPGSAEEDAAITTFRQQAAKRGANAIVTESSEGKTYMVAVVLTDGAKEVVKDLIAKNNDGPGATELEDGPTGASDGSAAPVNSSGPVHVRGYTRKDGTYVRPHTRSRPNR